MISADQHKEWLAHPTGRISKGEYCSCCARFNARTLAVNAIVLNENKVLLVKRAQEPDKGWWDLPGGYLDWDETLEEGTARELREETGLVASPASFQFLSLFSEPKNKTGNQVVDVYFITNTFTGEITVDPAEVLTAQWFELDALPEKVAFDHRQVLETVAARQY